MRLFILSSIIVILTAIIIFSIFVLSEKDAFKKRYAFCMLGQPRAIKPTIDNLYKNLIEPLNADVFLLLQKTHTDIDNDFNLFEKNVVEKILYDPPEKISDKYKYFDKFEKNCKHLKKDAILQLWYNCHLTNEHFGDALQNNYEYIILTRSDYLYLFPFPDILELTNNESKNIWVFDGHEYSGVNSTLMCIPSIYIKNLLASCYDYLQNWDDLERLMRSSKYCDDVNPEYFMQQIMEHNNFRLGKIQNNAFITGVSENDITTTDYKIKYDEEHRVYYKYREQLNNTFEALSQYENGKRWTFTKDEEFDRIVLETPSS